MPEDRMTRVARELFEAAADEGRREHRSDRQQLEHWARLGQELSAHEAAARRRITAAVGGEVPLAELAAEERVVANIETDVAIREQAAATTSFGRSVLKDGAVVVDLDEHRVQTAFSPDGTTRPFEGSPDLGARAGRRRPPS